MADLSALAPRWPSRHSLACIGAANIVSPVIDQPTFSSSSMADLIQVFLATNLKTCRRLPPRSSGNSTEQQVQQTDCCARGTNNLGRTANVVSIRAKWRRVLASIWRIAPARMPARRRFVSRIRITGAADPADGRSALLEGGKAAIGRRNLVAAILSAPRLIFRVGQCAKPRCRRTESQYYQHCLHSRHSGSKLSWHSPLMPVTNARTHTSITCAQHRPQSRMISK